MSTQDDTQKWMDATIVSLPEQLGRLTIAEAAQVMDALSGVYVVCARAMHEHRDNPYWEARLEKLRRSSDFSLAQARSLLSEWKRSTGWRIPDKSAVQQFIWKISH